MPPIPKERRDWLPELALAIDAINRALAGREPTPRRLAALKSKFVDAVPEHKIDLGYLSRGYLNDPDIDEPGEPEYAITITGRRLTVGWLIPEADLPAILALVGE